MSENDPFQSHIIPRVEALEKRMDHMEPDVGDVRVKVAVMEERLAGMAGDVREIARGMGRLVAVGLGVITVTFAALIAALIDALMR